MFVTTSHSLEGSIPRITVVHGDLALSSADISPGSVIFIPPPEGIGLLETNSKVYVVCALITVSRGRIFTPVRIPGVAVMLLPE